MKLPVMTVAVDIVVLTIAGARLQVALVERGIPPYEGKDDRSEERRVGKECRSRWSPYH